MNQAERKDFSKPDEVREFSRVVRNEPAVVIDYAGSR